ncbi:MAG: hypothetical protein JWL61_5542 [Gemmatimonadetes bacterium]|nr:hypothetical protein [Gemmatimonadota bacterium]
MSRQARVIAGGIVAVLLFDLIASYASLAFEFSYARASVGSYFIYLITGVSGARASLTSRARQGAIAAAIVGFADASAGLAISWIIGPGRPPDGTLSPAEWIVTAVIVVLFAGAVGFLGGAVGARSNPNVAG